jgi:uncharacterized Zn finger protein
MAFWDERRYVSVEKRRKRDGRHAAKLQKKGRVLQPVAADRSRRAIAATFWGRAWCDNLEHYSDLASRMPRGRTYVRSGAVLDLQIAAGRVTALVSGSDIYEVEIGIKPLAAARWQAIVGECAGQIASVVELLQGKLSEAVMEKLVHPDKGMFPAPRELEMTCSCPDWANMCKHIAAVMYGIGVRLDIQPEIFFTLRQVDQLELVAAAGSGGLTKKQGKTGKKVIARAQLSSVFGIDLDGDGADATEVTPASPPASTPRRRTSAPGGARKRAP